METTDEPCAARGVTWSCSWHCRRADDAAHEISRQDTGLARGVFQSLRHWLFGHQRLASLPLRGVWGNGRAIGEHTRRDYHQSLRANPCDGADFRGTSGLGGEILACLKL